MAELRVGVLLLTTLELSAIECVFVLGCILKHAQGTVYDTRASMCMHAGHSMHTLTKKGVPQ